MDGLFMFLSIIMIVFGFLQIILFFKLWGMTNNVKKLTKEFTPDLDRIIKEIHKKNPDIANLLFDSLYDDMCRAFKADTPGQDKYGKVKAKYKELYKKAGVEFPPVFKSINIDTDWLAAFGDQFFMPENTPGK